MPKHLMVAGPIAAVPDDAEHDPGLRLIVGQDVIAREIGIGSDRVAHLIAAGAPIWKLGVTYVARRAALAAWLAERERAAVAERKGER